METIKYALGLSGSTNDNETRANQEPLSGETGKGTATDPYDAGNAADNTHPKSGTEPLSGQTGPGTATEPYDAGNTAGKFQHARSEDLQSCSVSAARPTPYLADKGTI